MIDWSLRRCQLIGATWNAIKAVQRACEKVLHVSRVSRQVPCREDLQDARLQRDSYAKLSWLPIYTKQVDVWVPNAYVMH